MSLVVLSTKEPSSRTFYIQRWDDKGFTIEAGSYYKTESSYVFTRLTFSELKKHWMQGTLMEVPPLLEMDIDSVLMIVDQQHYAASSQQPTVKRAPRKKKT